MLGGRRVSPHLRRYIAEIVLVLFPVVIALYVADVSREVTLYLLAGSTGVTIVGKYFTVHLPLVSFKDRELTAFLDHYLELLVKDYKRMHPGDYRLRVNVMIPDTDLNVRVRGPNRGLNREPFLQIGYDSGGYEELELRRQWQLGQGCVGKAYENNEQRVATRSTDKQTWGSEWEMNPEQIKATEGVNSVFCTPIYKPGDEPKDDPVAILSLDSPDNVTQVGFEDAEIQDMVAQKYATKIGILL